MPAVQLPVPGITFATTDRGGQYMGKLNAIAAAIDAAIGGYNLQLSAANDAQLHAQALAGSLATAAASATKAQDWADKAVDVVVESGKYSAKHHATKGAASAVKAADWAEKAEDSPVEAGKYSAKHHATKGAASAVKAQDWAEKAEDSPVEAGKYSSKHHATKGAASAVKAQDWAEKAEDSPVEAGKYSAKHHSAKAAGSNTSAAGHRAAALASELKSADWAEKAENSPVEPGKFSAKHHAIKTALDAAFAKQWASAPEDGKYSAFHYTQKAEYWANLAAASVTGAMVFVGAYNASGNTWPAGAQTGYTYRISAQGTLGPFADGVTRTVRSGDIIIKRSDGQWDFWDAMDSDVVRLAATINGYTLSGPIVLGFPDLSGQAAVAQIPNLPASIITSGTLPVARGGTGRTDGKAVALATPRTIAGVSFDGSANILIPPGNVGAMPVAATQVTDWNTATENGPYFSVSGAANVPKAAAGWQGFVSRLNAENIRQIVWSADGPAVELYSRCGDGTPLVFGEWVCLRHSHDGLDATRQISAATSITRKGVVTRCTITATTSFAVAIASSGYSDGDSIEMSIAVSAGAVLTLTATQAMAVTGGTGGTSHTVTGPRHINVRAVFNGSTWQLFVS
jgi:hypothetical protein